MNRWAYVGVICLPLMGCDIFKKVKDTVEGATNPLVVEGMVLGVEANEDTDSFDLSDTPYGEGTSLTSFLAEADSVANLSEAPVAGASLMLEGVAATETVAGSYNIAPGTLEYVEGAEWVLEATIEDELSTVTLALPPESGVAVPEVHDADTAMTLDFSGEGVHAALIVVMSTDGEVTWSNQPSTITEFYDFSHGADTATTVEIPAEAFPSEALYAVGVAGMMHTTADSFDNVNTVLSSVVAGKMVFSPVSTIGQ